MVERAPLISVAPDWTTPVKAEPEQRTDKNNWRRDDDERASDDLVGGDFHGWLVVRTASGPMQKSYQFGSGLPTIWIRYWSDSNPYC